MLDEFHEAIKHTSSGNKELLKKVEEEVADFSDKLNIERENCDKPKVVIKAENQTTGQAIIQAYTHDLKQEDIRFKNGKISLYEIDGVIYSVCGRINEFGWRNYC